LELITKHRYNPVGVACLLWVANPGTPAEPVVQWHPILITDP